MKIRNKAAVFISSAIIALSAGAINAAATDNSASVAEINSTNFPDNTFRSYVSENFDSNGDGWLSQNECLNVETIDVSGTESAKGNIQSLKGVEFFTNLTELNCAYNQLTSLDVSKCTGLISLDCFDNNLTRIDVSGCTSLDYLNLNINSLTNLDVSDCNALTVLCFCSNNLTSIDISNCTNLTELYCHSNSLTSLDVSNCTDLTYLICNINNLTSLDVSNCPDLKWLRFENNKVTRVDVTECPHLKYLYCWDNNLSSLDVTQFPALTELVCYNNNLSSLDVSNCTDLYYLDCSDNNLSSLDVSNCTVLKYLNCYSNSYTFGTVNESYPLNSLPGFDASKASNWQGAEYDSKTNSLINFTSDFVTYTYDCGNGFECSFVLINESCPKCTVTFPEGISINSNIFGSIQNGESVPWGDVLYIGMELNSYRDHKVMLNGNEITLTPNGDVHYCNYAYTVYSEDITVKLEESTWSDERMSNYVVLNADEGIKVYWYNRYNGYIPNYPNTIPNGSIIPKGSAICIRIPSSDYPKKPDVYINGTLVDCSLNNDGMWQIWAYDVPDTQKINISINKNEIKDDIKISMGEKVYAYYKDNAGNWGQIFDGSTILPTYSEIIVHVDIDDYVDHALYVNDRELALSQTGDGYHFYGAIRYPYSYDKLEIKLVDKAWTNTELSNYVRVYADDGINVYHYSSYFNEAKIDYSVPVGGYFTKDEAIVIRADATKYPNAGTIYINGKPVKCTLNDDNQWQIWAYEIPDDSNVLKISFSDSEKICDVISGVTVTEKKYYSKIQQCR